MPPFLSGACTASSLPPLAASVHLPALPPAARPPIHAPPQSKLSCLTARTCSAKACWLAGHYADIEFGDGQGKGPTFSALLQRVVAAIGGERPGERGFVACGNPQT